jgi:hypothetical protein
MPTSQERRNLEERLSEAKKKKESRKAGTGKENKEVRKKADARKVRSKPKIQYVCMLSFLDIVHGDIF